MMNTASTNKLKYLQPEILSALDNMELRARLVVEGIIAGMHRSPYHGFSAEFAEHRQYMPGDEIRHIDWKVYAKTDRYYVKQFEEETNLKAYILLDSSASMNFKSKGPVSKFEYASYFVSALAFMLMKQRDAVGLLTFDETIRQYLPPRSTKSYLFEIWRQLERAVPSKKTHIAGTLHEMAERIKRRGLIILISDLLDNPAEIMSGLKHFRHRNHEVLVFQTLDPYEISFDFSRNAIFEDMETGEKIAAQPWHIRQNYQQRMADFVHNYKMACRENGIDYMLMNTSHSLEKSLFEFLVKRKRIGG